MCVLVILHPETGVAYSLIPTTSARSPEATTTAPAGNGIATPTPIQADMVSNCKSFYLVVAGDQCGKGHYPC